MINAFWPDEELTRTDVINLILKKAEDHFISSDIKSDTYIFYRYKLLLNASLFTSLFSLLYLIVSVIIEFRLGVYFMVFNVAGFLLLPFLMKTRVSVIILGNLYVFIGTVAVVILIYYSGGIHSPVFPWLIAPPVLALLIVNRFYSLIWTGISVACLTLFIVSAMAGSVYPVNYDQDWHLVFVLLSSSGIVLIVVMIAMIFESNTMKTLYALEVQRKELQQSKEELADRHREIIEKNESLTAHREELLTTSEQLKELNDKKDYLMEILAHDLKSPLSNMQSLIGLLNKDLYPVDSMERKAIEHIEDASKKAQALIQKILSTENLENIVYNLKLESVDVSEILRGVVNNIRESAKRKNISIHLAIADHKNYRTAADKIYLAQVFENLLNNAVKFSEPGKKVIAAVDTSDKTIRTEIKDEGPGIAATEMSLLFKKFKKLSNKPTGGESSTGLGLFIVKHYTELLKGKIWCESVPGKGSSFIVELPIY